MFVFGQRTVKIVPINGNKVCNYTCSYLHIRLFYPKYPNLFSKKRNHN
jgi:hypothetical protein